ncbi:MAG TPA: hypothetical protein ENK15_08960 [Thermopetrobacter sp.]|nr:hypothetical protein [Thermopetrobacter sp.]
MPQARAQIHLRGHARAALRAVLPLALLSGMTAAAPAPEKDQSRIGDAPIVSPEKPKLKADPGLLDGGGGKSPEAAPGGPDDTEHLDDEPPLHTMIEEDIPGVEAVELNLERAKKALDAFAAVFGKFDDAEIDKYKTLQEFADKTEAGKKMQAIIRQHGFRNVAEWNNIIINIGFAYSSLLEGNDDSIRRQIEDLKKDGSLDEDKRKKAIAALQVLIPSDNNRKVVKQLMDDPAYAKKLELLDAE